jgi:hypothetical protein
VKCINLLSFIFFENQGVKEWAGLERWQLQEITPLTQGHTFIDGTGRARLRQNNGSARGRKGGAGWGSGVVAQGGGALAAGLAGYDRESA